MKRITAIARGEVQRVGYRDEVERIARRFKLTGYVENLKPYDVRVVAEGEEEKLKKFIEQIKIRRFPIIVESLEVSWEKATGEFKYFEIKRGEWQEELFERLDIAGKLLYRSVELGERSVRIGEATLEAIREESKKTRDVLGAKIDNLGTKIDSAKNDIAGKIDLHRVDLREYIEVNLKNPFKDFRNRKGIKKSWNNVA